MKKVILFISLLFAFVCFTFTMPKQVIVDNDIGLTTTITVNPYICDVVDQVALSGTEITSIQITDIACNNMDMKNSLIYDVELWTYQHTPIKLTLYNKESQINHRYLPRLMFATLHHNPGDSKS